MTNQMALRDAPRSSAILPRAPAPNRATVTQHKIRPSRFTPQTPEAQEKARKTTPRASYASAAQASIMFRCFIRRSIRIGWRRPAIWRCPFHGGHHSLKLVVSWPLRRWEAVPSREDQDQVLFRHDPQLLAAETARCPCEFFRRFAIELQPPLEAISPAPPCGLLAPIRSHV